MRGLIHWFDLLRDVVYVHEINPGALGFNGGVNVNGKWINAEQPNFEDLSSLIRKLYDVMTEFKINRWNKAVFSISKSNHSIDYIWDSEYQDEVNSYNDLKWDGYNMRLDRYSLL